MSHEIQSIGQLKLAQPAHLLARRGSAAQPMPHLSSQKLNRLRNALAMNG
jgi:hypothetical protein